MKKHLLTLIFCLGLTGLMAQNIWKPITCNSPFLGAASNGDLFAMAGYSGLVRSHDEGVTWEQVNDNYMNQCIAFSPQGRIFVSPSNYTYLQYSDDGGDTWHETSIMSSCAMYDIGGIEAVSNDTVVVWSSNGEMYYTLDGGATWNFGGVELDEYHQVGDLIANEAGDVYVSKWYYSGEDSGIFHSTLSDMQNWELAAFDGVVILQMEFDPEGNVVACGWNPEGSIGFQHTQGFYLLEHTSLAIGDGGIVYAPHFAGHSAVLAYSIDHGEHFTEIGEDIPVVDIAPGGEDPRLFLGADNHLYFDAGGEYWKSVRDADNILETFPRGTEWYYEIQHVTGDVTYQHLEYTADTAVNSKRVKIITETNTMYDKSTWTDQEFIYEDGDRIYWWNKDLEDFTLLYDFGADVGDEWEINGGWYTITVHVDEAHTVTYKSETYRVLSVTDAAYGLFTGDIICGIGHQKSFFPLSPIAKDYEVNGLRCFWQDGELVLNMNGEDCDAIYTEIHDIDENNSASFAIYPNPSNGLLTIQNSSLLTPNSSFVITNLLGQTVQSGALTSSPQQINVQTLPNGMYYLTIGNQSQKIIINRP